MPQFFTSPCTHTLAMSQGASPAKASLVHPLIYIENPQLSELINTINSIMFKEISKELKQI